MLKANQIKKLQKLQIKCIELITGKLPVLKTYQSLQILRIVEIIKLQNLKLGHKVQYPQLPTMIYNACVSDIQGKPLVKNHHYDTRRKCEPNCPKPQTEWYKSSFLVKSLKDFQNLPVKIRNMANYNHFVSSCKKLLLTN